MFKIQIEWWPERDSIHQNRIPAKWIATSITIKKISLQQAIQIPCQISQTRQTDNKKKISNTKPL